MKTKFKLSLLTVMGLLMLATSCKKEEKKENVPTPIPTTTAGKFPDVLIWGISDITQTSATCETRMFIFESGVTKVTAKGVCWGTNLYPDITGYHTTDGSDTNSFKSNITGLHPNVDYNVRAYATNSAGTTYSGISSFKTTAGLGIGSGHQGGVIAYIFQSGDAGYVAGEMHGLIVTSYDQSSGIKWTNGSYPTIPTSSAIGTGNANTNSIISIQGTGSYAAKLCADLVLGGYSDWYLPSKDELNELYNNRALIGGFANEFYWSSTQDDINYSWGQDYGSGFQDSSRSYVWRVRAVRTF